MTLTALAYADDVAITIDSVSGAERTSRWLQFHSEAIGLKLNAAKILRYFMLDMRVILNQF